MMGTYGRRVKAVLKPKKKKAATRKTVSRKPKMPKSKA